MTTAGRSLTDVRRIVIYRYVEELPVPAAGRDPNAILPGDIDTTLPQPVALFAKIPTIPQAQFAKLSDKVESIEKANLAAATAGAKLFYADAPPFRSRDGRPVRLTYAVVTEGETARSEFSNLAIIVPLPVAAPPKTLTATARPEGVVLTWAAPTTSVTQDPPIITGYNIYRTAPGDTATPDTQTPINTGIVTGTTYTDVPPYGEHEYRVAAVGALGPPLLQSDVSLPARATFKDLVPPPAPAKVTPLIELSSVRLFWEPVDAPDLAGYRIYRAEGAGHGADIKEVGEIQLVTDPIPDTNWLHGRLSLGLSFRYAVTAVDKSGNESARTWTEWLVVPKTP